MQKDLSIDRPCSPAIHVPCSFRMKQISCRSHVVCGLTSNNSVIIRKGITKLKEEGSEWLCLKWYATNFPQLEDYYKSSDISRVSPT